MMRICFGRKRKVLRSSFIMTYTLKTLEENYNTWCALTGNKPEKRKFKELVLEALEAADLADKRAITLDLDTYFRLLLEFNKRGIHFTNASAGTKIGAVPDAQVPDALFEDGGEAEEE